MKQKLLNMLFALTAMVGSATAQTLSIASIEAEAGTQVELVVKGAGLGGVTALQFNLSLPEGITLDEASITKGPAANGQELSVSTLDNGDRLFILYNMALNTFGTGELLRIPVNVGSEAQTGEDRRHRCRRSSRTRRPSSPWTLQMTWCLKLCFVVVVLFEGDDDKVVSVRYYPLLHFLL